MIACGATHIVSLSKRAHIRAHSYTAHYYKGGDGEGGIRSTQRRGDGKSPVGRRAVAIIVSADGEDTQGGEGLGMGH